MGLALVASIAFCDLALAVATPNANVPVRARWLAAGQPLVAIDARSVRPPGRAGCSWATVGSHWLEVDHAGRVTGEVRVTGLGEADATDCPDPRFERVSGHEPKPSWSQLLVSAGGYRASAPAWMPTTDGEASDGAHEATFPVGTHLFHVWVETRVQVDWFLVIDDVSTQHPLRSQKWRAEGPSGVMAVFDIDGDGIPEIILQEGGDGCWRVTVLRFDGRAWRRVGKTGWMSTA
jgi:hypothetical protein